MSFQWIAPTSFAVSIGASCLLSLPPTRQLSTPVRLALGTAVLAAFVAGFWLLARGFTHA
jgi:lysozyme family protein